MALLITSTPRNALNAPGAVETCTGSKAHLGLLVLTAESLLTPPRSCWGFCLGFHKEGEHLFSSPPTSLPLWAARGWDS